MTQQDCLILGGRAFTSRFILGSGKYSLDLIEAAVAKAGAQIITLALRRINPDVEIVSLPVKITSGNAREVFAGCDVIVEAFDRAEAKRMLVEAFYSSGKFLVAASGLAGWGNADAIMTLQVHDYFYMVGDLVSEVGTGIPPCAPRVNIAAAKQADLILSLALKQEHSHSEDYNI